MRAVFVRVLIRRHVLLGSEKVSVNRQREREKQEAWERGGPTLRKAFLHFLHMKTISVVRARLWSDFSASESFQACQSQLVAKEKRKC